MTKNRQLRIMELVNERDIETQEELAELLNADGFDVTQATVSRDIKELNLVKQIHISYVGQFIFHRNASRFF